MKKIWLICFFVFLGLFTSQSNTFAEASWENCLWVSADTDNYQNRIGYFHNDDYLVKLTFDRLDNDVNRFQVALSNEIIEFSKSTGLYGEIGLSSQEEFEAFFGAGLSLYKSKSLLLKIGTKYYTGDQLQVNEVEAFIKFINPLVLSLQYDDHIDRFFIGVGLTFY